MPIFNMSLLTLWLVAFLVPLAKAHTYQSAIAGACRGPGGNTDKVNSRWVHERSAEDCKKDCDDEAYCVGYTYHAEANGGECIIYGPGMAGSCSVNTAQSPAECAALGSCADTLKLTEATCGSCSEVSAPNAESCASVRGTWTKIAWTSADATWNDATDPWSGEWHHSVIIKGSVAASGYLCYDIDPSDHEATCTGSANCIASFAGKTADLQISSNCPSGCTFTKAVAGAPTAKVPHAPALSLADYTPTSGACRGPGNSKVNGKYSNTAGAAGKLTERECANACDAEQNCVGYAHSTAWCIVYGPGVNNTAGADWTADTHTSTSITGTKPNVAYICQVKSASDQSSAAIESCSHSLLGIASILILNIFAML